MATNPIKTVSDLEAATRDALGHLQAHGIVSQTMLARHRNALASIYNDKRWSNEGRAAQLKQERGRFQQEVTQHIAATQAASDALASAHQRARMPIGDSAAQLLAFQREQDGVERARKHVAAGKSMLAIIQEAGKSGDTAMLAGLRRHLPSELATMEAKAPGAVAAHLEALGKAEEPHLPEVERAVRAQEARLTALQAATKWNHTALTTATESPIGHPGVASFIGGDDGRQAISVGATPIGLPNG